MTVCCTRRTVWTYLGWPQARQHSARISASCNVHLEESWNGENMDINMYIVVYKTNVFITIFCHLLLENIKCKMIALWLHQQISSLWLFSKMNALWFVYPKWTFDKCFWRSFLIRDNRAIFWYFKVQLSESLTRLTLTCVLPRCSPPCSGSPQSPASPPWAG